MKTPSDLIDELFPKSRDCLKGHIGPTVMTYQWEYDDDRGWLIKIPRCDHCYLPVGPDDYASSEEQEEYYRNLPARR